MGKYDQEVADARQLIAEFGGKVLVKTFSSSIPDPSKPWLTDPTVTDHPNVDLCLIPNRGYEKDGNVTTSSERGYLSVDFAVDTNTEIHLANGRVLKILRFTALSPSTDQVILYTFELTQ